MPMCKRQVHICMHLKGLGSRLNMLQLHLNIFGWRICCKIAKGRMQTWGCYLAMRRETLQVQSLANLHLLFWKPLCLYYKQTLRVHSCMQHCTACCPKACSLLCVQRCRLCMHDCRHCSARRSFQLCFFNLILFESIAEQDSGVKAGEICACMFIFFIF